MHFEYAVQKGVNVFMEKSFAVDAPGGAPHVEGRRSGREEEPQGRLRLHVAALEGAAGSDPADPRRRDRRRAHAADLSRPRAGALPAATQGPERSEFQIRTPNCFTWVSSGFFIDWHCHNVDMACWAKNAWPVEAQGMGGRCYPEAGNLFDHYTVEYTFADGAKLFCLLAPHAELLARTPITRTARRARR